MGGRMIMRRRVMDGDLLRPAQKTVGPSAVVSVTDARQENALDVTIGIEPVQDLHGYDAPWPAGGAANKCPEQWEPGMYDVTNGEKKNGSNYIRSTTMFPVLPETSYCYVKPSGNATRILFYDSNGDFISAPDLIFPNHTSDVFTTPQGVYFMTTYTAEASYNNDVAINYPSTISTYSPYSNICPITGWTGAQLTRTGKNLLDIDRYVMPLPKTQNGITWSKVRDGVYHVSGTATGTSYFNVSFNAISAQDAMPCTSFIGQRVRLSTTTDARVIPSLGYFREDNTFTNMNNGGVLPDDAAWFRAYLSVVKDTVIDTDFSIQLELGSTATDYEPYQGETYDITFPSEAGTVYGGTLDVTTGVLTVDRAYALLNDKSLWQESQSSTTPFVYYYNFSDRKIYSNSYVGLICTYLTVDASKQNMTARWTGAASSKFGFNTTDAPNITIGDIRADAEAGKIAIVYELATPITYQLTPQQVALLLGNNTIFADTGDTTLTYWCGIPIILSNL